MKQVDDRKNTLHASIGPMELMDGVPTAMVTVSYRVMAGDVQLALARMLAAANVEMKA